MGQVVAIFAAVNVTLLLDKVSNFDLLLVA
jgi:hypothetical protein